MTLFKTKKQYRYKPFQRSSLLARFKSKYRLKSEYWPLEKPQPKFRSRSLFSNLHRTYRSLCLSVTFIVRLFIIIDRITRKILRFIETLIRIIHTVHGWIQMLRSIFSAIHLIIARLMNLTFKIYQIFYLLSILFEPFTNRTFEKTVSSFSNFFYKYYSSNGGCYTLKARTYHIINGIRMRWKKPNMITCDEDIYYDALNEEYQ
ncbi:unnamed protein product [Adineta steineri]|uniref:Uncharacterized protein n=1 Tax=Adineta steineri TaxID=433720 RepID=A0A819SF70_9BILA|nr:unnamed protein product [Adineta steineri]CAF4058789.1 unnamed protein product [Adineta steineri]